MLIFSINKITAEFILFYCTLQAIAEANQKFLSKYILEIDGTNLLYSTSSEIMIRPYVTLVPSVCKLLIMKKQIYYMIVS